MKAMMMRVTMAVISMNTISNQMTLKRERRILVTMITKKKMMRKMLEKKMMLRMVGALVEKKKKMSTRTIVRMRTRMREIPMKITKGIYQLTHTSLRKGRTFMGGLQMT